MLERITKNLSIIIGALIVIVIGGFFGWYFFINKAQIQTAQENAARNYNGTVPSFTGSTGSTYQNVVSTVAGSINAGATATSSRLWEVSIVPVAGFAWGPISSTPSLYFVERSTGYELQAHTEDRSVVRLSDTLRPKTYEALVARDGSVIERSVDTTGTTVTFAGQVATSSSTSTPALTGILLPQNIPSITIDPISKTLYYMISQSSGTSLISSDWTGKKEKHLFSSTISGWDLIAPGDGSLYLLQKPLDGSLGYAYKLQKDGSLAPLAQALGLTIAPRTSSANLLYSSSSDGVLSLFAQANPQANPTHLPVQTIAEKCAWAKGLTSTSSIAYCGVPQSVPSQHFLDDWYKGIVHTSDVFYSVDTAAASSSILYDPRGQTGTQLDIQNPSVDPTGQYLAFINAADQSLWVLRINQ
ncbi:MAG TPA: hypothetical protein VMU25_02370 [Candidatus Paceibacterota bacterium]|nr:hypothetical protein [Candidatus Paceibacterota bacterium]